MVRLLKASKRKAKVKGGGDEKWEGEDKKEMEKVLVREILNVDKNLLEAQKETGDISGSNEFLILLNYIIRFIIFL